MTDAQAIFDRYKIVCEGSGTPGSSLTATERRCQMCNKHYLHATTIPRHHRFDVLAALNDGALDEMTRDEAWEIHRLERLAF